jgi:hypothetical protein
VPNTRSSGASPRRRSGHRGLLAAAVLVSVAVLTVLIVPLAVAAANTLFSDNFESGNTAAWSGTTQTGSASTVRVAATAAQSGLNGLDTAKLGARDNGRAEVFRALNAPASKVVSVQSYLRVVSRTGTGGLYLQRIYRAAPIYKPLAAIHHNGSTYGLQIRPLSGATLIDTPLHTQFATGTWYLVELVYDWSGAQPVARVYINGQLDTAVTDSTSGTLLTPDSAYLGLYEDAWTQQADVQWDNVSVADGIQSTAGVPASTSTPTPTRIPSTATPTATATATNTAGSGSTLFQSGFESGNFSDWSGTTLAGSGEVAEVTTQAAQTGAEGAHFSNGAGAKNGAAQAWKTLSSNTNPVVTLQAAVHVNSVSGDGRLVLLELHHDAPVFNGLARFQYANGAWQFSLRGRDGNWINSAPAALGLGAWHQVQLTYDASGSQPVLRGSIDGAASSSVTDTSAGTVYLADSVYVGAREDAWTATGDLWIDDVSANSGSGGSGTSLTPSPTATPPPTSTPTSVASTPTPTNTAVPPTATATSTSTSIPTATPTQSSAGQGPLRRVNAPFFNSTVDASQAGVFWLGQVAPNLSYADVRMAYTSSEIYALVTVIDRQLWYQPGLTSPSPDLTTYDSSTLLLNPPGQTGTTVGANSYRFDAEINWSEASRNGYQAAYVGNGTTWAARSIAFTTTSGWRGDQGPNSGVDAKGWVITYHIPYSSLGLAGPPPQGSTWGLGLQLHNRDDSSGTPIADQVWPSGLASTNPSTWGQLGFGLPSFTAPGIAQSGSTSIAQGLNGASVPDGAVGGYTNCGAAAASVNYFPTWGSLNYNGNTDFNVQNESDVSDFPCFSKYYVTFPLASIPAGKTILNAQLVLHQFGNSGNPDTSLLQVYTVDQPWSPATLTWNNAPLARENVSQALVGPLSSTPPWPGVARQFDLSYAVAQAYAAHQSTLMLAVYSPDSNYGSGKYFVSSETGDWNAAGRPTLQVSWGG